MAQPQTSDGRTIAGGPAQPVAVLTPIETTPAAGSVQTVTAAQLPAVLTAGGSLKTAVQEALPAGSSVIGGVTEADGANVVLGAVADPSHTTDVAGTISSKLRGIRALIINLLSRWPAALGATTRSGSLPVALATDATGANAPQFVISNSVGTLAQVAQFGAADANGGSLAGLVTSTYPLIFNGAFFDRLRTANVFKTGTATGSGSTAIWTSAVGKKWRLMGYQIEITGDASLASAGVLTVSFLDVAAAINISHSIYLPVAAPALPGIIPPINCPPGMGNGILAAATNTALNVNLSAALTSGTIRVNVFGTEE